VSKEVEQLKADLDLVTKTARVLATKLDKISKKIELILGSIDETQIPKDLSSKTIASSQSKTQPASSTDTIATSQAPSRVTPRRSQPVDASSKASRLLDSFHGQVQSMTNGKEIASELSRLRDQVMQSAEVGFHPAFHEMGRYADQIKKIRAISVAEREELLEKIYDWKTRLSS
jgi:hypothetical protein